MTALTSQPLDVAKVPLSGVHLIEASAGTGKTYTITALVLRLLVEEELPLRQIAAVTFTNAATAELRDRVSRRIRGARELFDNALESGSPSPALLEDPVLSALWARPERRRTFLLLNQAARDADEAAIFTIHGFTQRLLREHAFEGGARLEVELTLEQSRLVYDAFRDFWAKEVATLPRERFELLGGAELFGELEAVAKGASAHPDVPLVELPKTPGGEAIRREVEFAFSELVQAGEAALGEATAELCSPRINKQTYREPTVLAAAEEWLSILRGPRAPTKVSEPAKKWAQSVVTRGTKKGMRVAHFFFEVVERLIVALEAEEKFFDSERRELFLALVNFVRARLREEHTRSRSQSFDDLLLTLRDALRDERTGPNLRASLRKRYPVALIDEFQDTDPVQYEIFRRLFVPTPEEGSRSSGLFLIGDPKQSIYSFRGADVHAYLTARELATGGRWTLTTSYRSGPEVVAAQNLLFSRLTHPFVLAGVDYQNIAAAPGRTDLLRRANGDACPGILFRKGAKRDRELLAEGTARAIAEHLEAGLRLDGVPLAPNHIAVLTRTNREAAQVQKALLARGIPAVLHGDRSVFEADEALELRRILQALAEPKNQRRLRAALVTRFLGVDALTLGRLTEEPELFELWSTRFVVAAEKWRGKGIAYALSHLEHEGALLIRTLKEPDGERRMTNFRHLLELLHEAEVAEHLGVSGLLRFLDASIADPMGHGMAPEARQVRLESDAAAVTLTTVHKSKGLEYDLVFLPTLHGSAEPWPSEVFRAHEPENGSSVLDVRGKDSDYWPEYIEENRSEGMRLAYVALTRAKHQLVVVFPAFGDESPKNKTENFSPLGYLLHGPSLGTGTTIGDFLGRLPAREEERAYAVLVEQGAGAIEFTSAPVARRWVSRREAREVVALSARPLPEALPEGSRSSSFSSMTRLHGTSRLSRAAREGRDVDEEVLSGVEGERTSGFERANASVTLAAYPRGAGPGEALHGIFERSSFLPGAEAARRVLVVEELARRGLSVDLAEKVSLAVEEVLMTPLSERANFRLADIDQAGKFPEMEFSFPVGADESRISALRLARGLGLGRPGGTLPPEYLEDVARLPFRKWSGFLRGFIDLVLEKDGRFYVLDYKSNFLGEAYADYGGRAMALAMAEHHYHLQAALYVVAVHRHLRRRIPGYDYETHFGGVFYLFVRGMHPDLGASRGIYGYRPTKEEVERLSEALSEPEKFGPLEEASLFEGDFWDEGGVGG